MNPTQAESAHSKSTKDDPRWAFVLARDQEADGRFYYSVSTTGVYCRPSCAARLAKPENVRFHATCDEAEQAGFRPCKRCKPKEHLQSERYATMVTQACRLIEQAQTPLNLENLAQQVGVSTYHFHRLFKKLTGLTPREYASAQREQRIRKELQKSGSVTAAIFEAGYQANSRFYENSDHVLGMTPKKYRAGGMNSRIHFAVGECSLGAILVAQSERGICAIFLGEEPEQLVRDLQDRFRHAELIGGDQGFEQLIAQVVGFIDNPNIGWQLPLDVRGTVFQQRVWQALREIPAGQTISYTELAHRIGHPKAVRAVASACAANAIAVAIPCHRVVRTDGNLSGYRWGVERKRLLLNRESN